MGEIYVAWQIKHGRRSDGWWFVVEAAGRPAEEHGPFDTEDAMLAAKLARMEELEGHDTERERDPFPLLEETSDPRELPTVEEWLAAGAPMRQVDAAEWKSVKEKRSPDEADG